MKEVQFSLTIKVYEDSEELHPEYRALLLEAKKALQLAYVPYSGFHVGAAVLLDNGKVISGFNQENAAYSMCLCAERVTLAAALSQFPGIPVRAMAVSVKNRSVRIDRPAAPCGACRQVICETEIRFQSDIAIILQGEAGPIHLFRSGKDLLPFCFDSSFL